jgi:hypothetical protein
VATTAQQPRPASPAKHDATVEAYLARARGRIRSLDATVGVLVLVCAALAFALGMVLCDRWLVLSPLTRQLALAVFGLAALLYALFGLVLPLCRRINPYYAARHLEQVVPGAKNSIVNWLDLHSEPLPPAFRAAVSQRAARDLADADLEQAISGRRVAWTGSLAAALAVAALVAMAVLGARPFFSLLGRTFAPFSEGLIATRTRLTLLQPEGGDTTVAVGRSVRFTVAVDGRVPQPGKSDALRLLFRYQQGDPYEERSLEPSNDQWATTLPAFQVQNGFWYKVAGGDSETPEFRVQVRATPLINGFDATYHYRPYLSWKDDTTHDPNLRALRGTEVRLVAHTNRAVNVRDSRLELDLAPKGAEGVRKTFAAEAVADDPQALAFRLVQEENGKYRVWFTSTDGEGNTEPMAYTVQVLPDHPPQVELTKPGQDVTLPVNGLLRLEGVANDDIGVKSLTLRLRVAEGAELRPQPYREGKSFRLAEGGYPKTLEYKDAVDLAKAQDADGKPAGLRPKMVLEYWLEAQDDCDYPGPNVGRSKVYKVTLGEPDADQKKQEQERQKAQQEQQQHEKKQDEQLKQEGQNPRQDSNPDHARQNQPEQDKNDAKKADQPQGENKPGDKPNEQPKVGEQPGDKPNEQPKPGEQAGAKPDQGDKPNDKGEPNAGQKGDTNPPGKPDEREQKAQQLAKALQNGQDKPGAKEGAQEPKGENKDQGDAKRNQSAAKDGHEGAAKPEAGNPKEGTGTKPPGEKKEPGKPGNSGEEKPATPKEAGHDQGSSGPKAEDKPSGEKKNNGGSPQGEPKEQQTPKDPAAAGARDVQQLEKKLNDGSPSEQQAAEKKLEQVRQEAKDPAAREAAKQALEKHAQEKKESSPAAAKPQPKPPSDPKEAQQSCPCQCKNGTSGNNQKAGGSKGAGSGQGSDQKGESKGDAGSRQTASTNPGTKPNEQGGGKKDEGNNPGEAKPNGNKGQQGDTQTGGTGAGGTPGERLVGGRKPNGQAVNQDAPPPGETPTPERQGEPEKPRHAGDLVLEDLRKTLEELKKHPEEMKKVLNRARLQSKDLRDVEDYLNEKLPPPQQTGSLNNLGVRQGTAGKGGTSDAKVAAPAQPPPGFRDSTRAFTRELARPDKE